LSFGAAELKGRLGLYHLPNFTFLLLAALPLDECFSIGEIQSVARTSPRSGYCLLQLLEADTYPLSPGRHPSLSTERLAGSVWHHPMFSLPPFPGFHLPFDFVIRPPVAFFLFPCKPLPPPECLVTSPDAPHIGTTPFQVKTG